MLNLTEKQLHDFPLWKAKALDRVFDMQAIIKTALPTDYADNKLYNALTEVENELGNFKVQQNAVIYDCEEVKSEIAFGSCLQKFICKNQLLGTSALLEVILDELKKIFEI